MAPVSIHSPSRPETIAAPISTQTIRLVNCAPRIVQGEGGGASGSSLRPCIDRRRAASSSRNPSARLTSSARASSSGDCAYHRAWIFCPCSTIASDLSALPVPRWDPDPLRTHPERNRYSGKCFSFQEKPLVFITSTTRPYKKMWPSPCRRLNPCENTPIEYPRRTEHRPWIGRHSCGGNNRRLKLWIC
jgi:hypothetical protein